MIKTEDVQRKIDGKTKPLGSLGMLEKVALQLAQIQNTLTPSLSAPAVVVFAGDHGIANEGVSAYPQEVTYQMVYNFLQGGAAINVFCKQHGIQLEIVDAGVNFDFPKELNVQNQKVGYGTQSFRKTAAMNASELEQCLTFGAHISSKLSNTGTNIIGFGEMGIGNTSAASLIMHRITNIPLKTCVGRGTGLNDDQLNKKMAILEEANAIHPQHLDAPSILSTFGGFEIAQIVGAMLEAKQKGMAILVDGFIASSAFLIAHKMDESIIENAIFCHKSNESGHHAMLEYLEAEPLVDLNLRLGEGTGCALAFPIVQSAVHFMNEMASFEDANVSNKK